MYRKKMAEGGSVKTDKGYTKEQRSALKRLLEMIQPDAGDYIGEGIVETIKKPAVKKRGGGLARRGKGMALADGGPVSRNMARPVPAGGKGGAPMSGASQSRPVPAGGNGGPSVAIGRPTGPMARPGGSYGAPNNKQPTGGPRPRPGGMGLSRPMGMAKGGIVGRPARSYRDMKAGAGSGVGRVQKTKIQRGR